jgi:hypothetical protein
LYGILSSYSLAQFYLMEKSAKLLHYFGLDCGLLEFFKYPAFFVGRFEGKDGTFKIRV